MNRGAVRPRGLPGACEQGVALLVVLVLLAVISLTATVTMRSAITHEKVINNLRVEFSAQTSAELALRYCEDQLLEPPAHRVAAFQGVDSQPARTHATLRWTDYPTWVAARGGQATGVAYYRLPAASVNGVPPPECMVERVSLGGSPHLAWVVTARGFSADYQHDPDNGRTLSGSVVWLQSFTHVH